MGLTVSCARCHDHKFDAISQKDYYSLFGTLYGARPTQRAIDDPALLETNRDALAALKEEIRDGLADAWLDAAGTVGARLLEEAAAAAAASEAAAPARGVGQDGRDGSALAAWRELAAVDDADLPRAWEDLRARLGGGARRARAVQPRALRGGVGPRRRRLRRDGRARPGPPRGAVAARRVRDRAARATGC